MGCVNCCFETKEKKINIDEWEVTSFDDYSWIFHVSIFEGPLSQENRAHFFNEEKLTVKAPTNVFVVRGNNHIILIDAGFGRTLHKSLSMLKIKEKDVDMVLITHSHGDHASGLIKDSNAVFENATIFMSVAEKSAYVGKFSRETLMDKVAAAYGLRLQTFDYDTEIIHGIKAINLSGHTSGHSGFEFRGRKGTKIVFAGDFVHATHLQFANPEENSRYDENKQMSASSRRRIMQDAAVGKFLIAGTHIDSQGIGYVQSVGRGYRFSPI